MGEENVTGIVFTRKVTIDALVDAGVKLSRDVTDCTLRNACHVSTDESDDGKPFVQVGYVIEACGSEGRWENVMADLPDADDELNMAIVEELFGATDEEEAEMVREATRRMADARASSQT